MLSFQRNLSVGSHGTNVQKLDAGFEVPETVAEVLALLGRNFAVLYVHAPGLTPAQALGAVAETYPGQNGALPHARQEPLFPQL